MLRMQCSFVQMSSASMLFGLLMCPGCAPSRDDNPVAPATHAKHEADNLEQLIRDARNSDRDIRQSATGTLLDRLKPGMSQPEVEAWLGPPFAELRPAWIDEEEKTGHVPYYAQYPEYQGTWQVWVYYDLSKKPPTLLRLSGPHGRGFDSDPEDPPSRYDPNDVRGQGSSASTKDLISDVSSKDPAIHETAVGALLLRLRPGMTRTQVEDWIGPPDHDLKQHWINEDKFGYVFYRTRYPKLQGSRFMGVMYDFNHKPAQFTSLMKPLTTKEFDEYLPKGGK